MIFNFEGLEAEYPDSICSLDGGRIDNVKKIHIPSSKHMVQLSSNRRWGTKPADVVSRMQVL